MICPKEDELLAYVDGFLDNEESEQIKSHILSCPYCQQQLEVLASQDAFLTETLKTPVLPDDFAQKILYQVQPYQQKKKRKWKWGLGTAASILLAGGVLASVHPSFAELVGGIFTSDYVDQGLNIAMDTEIASPIDIAVTDAGITLHVEHVIADTSRIALSYSITNSKGKRLDPFLEENHEANTITLLDQNGKEVEVGGRGWRNTNDYGIFEFSSVDENFREGIIRIEATEIAGKSGNWLVEVPVDLTAAYAKQKVVIIDKTIEEAGLEINLDQVNYATSTTDITYKIQYNDKTKKEIQEAIKEKEEQFNKEIVSTFFPYNPTIGYRIENEKGEVLGYHNVYEREDRGHAVTENMIGGIGQWDGEIDEMGIMTNTDSFIPEKEPEELYFVLDTIYKPKVSNFSVTFKPDELPLTFEYEGYELTIISVERKVDYSLQKSVIPFDRQVTVELSMSGYANQRVPGLVEWAIEDDKGESYLTYNSGSTTLDETDSKGRFKHEEQLSSYELQDIPEEMTLHLIAETVPIKLEKEWRVPLFE
ncbi:MAG TPA: DUF4179 domain-containing protein [Ureibacillus sp.]|nr:DUF4179 domain-containing protein [Ureibacillus sp.]